MHDVQPEGDIMEAINTILKRATKLETLTVRGQRSVAVFHRFKHYQFD